MKKYEKYISLEWSVMDTDTQLPPEHVTIDKNGNLTADAKLAKVLNLEVKASAPVFETDASCKVTAIPTLKKITIDPETVIFFA